MKLAFSHQIFILTAVYAVHIIYAVEYKPHGNIGTATTSNKPPLKSSIRIWKPFSIVKQITQETKQFKNEASFQKYQFPPRGGRRNSESEEDTLLNDVKNEIVDLTLPLSEEKIVHSEANENTRKNLNNNAEAQNASVSATATATGTSPEYFVPHPQQQSFSSFYSPFHHSLNRRQISRSEEKAILGRAVLTTPHRRMPAIRIAPGPRPPFMCK